MKRERADALRICNSGTRSARSWRMFSGMLTTLPRPKTARRAPRRRPAAGCSLPSSVAPVVQSRLQHAAHLCEAFMRGMGRGEQQWRSSPQPHAFRRIGGSACDPDSSRRTALKHRLACVRVTDRARMSASSACVSQRRRSSRSLLRFAQPPSQQRKRNRHCNRKMNISMEQQANSSRATAAHQSLRRASSSSSRPSFKSLPEEFERRN